MRIVRPEIRALYVIVFAAVAISLTLFARTMTEYWALQALDSVRIVWLVAGILVGIRTFRGRNEQVAPPRPWWRWTARPKIGVWLTIYFLLGGLIGFVNIVVAVLRHTVGPPLVLTLSVVGVVVSIAIGVGYLVSSVRLSGRPDLLPPRTPKLSAPVDPASLPADRRPEGW